ncbi:Rieske 2Fe-2S domain-containing protein [Kineosporia sp. J2-2]|uniref:Rieske 2Fe-2S domain-containing protein n=1 Tax=Kineosporia corallincola TaxID=2835133 RepID=A0ABS5TQK3_9ACTN|nr:Rieske 2Fe-2S domain-containing protein [Kineosporia corallincola]MBT0773183.1 Rieske 2Fe-2S domain-containing protein [Kineosporia corallincola]
MRSTRLRSLPAAATGASDAADTAEAERRVGLMHAALNTAALSAFSASWVLRRSPGQGKISALVGLSFLGASGWLGGHLSYAMGVGVDTTAFSRPLADWTDVCEVTELIDGQPRSFAVDGLSVLLVSRAGRIDAMLNRCTHRGAPLDEGKLVGDWPRPASPRQ